MEPLEGQKIKSTLLIDYRAEGGDTSMKLEVAVPEVGESVTQGTITGWLKKEGDFVSEGEDLFELETDKATLAIPSPGSGILSIRIHDGSDVNVGQIVAELSSVEGKKKEALQRSESLPSQKPTTGTSGEKIEEVADTPRQMPLSPAVRRLVGELDLDTSTIEGSGKDGRITKSDVLEEFRRQSIKEPPAQPPSMETAVSVPGSQKRVKMTTIRRRTAERLVTAKQAAAHLTTFNEVDMQTIIRIRDLYRESFEKKHGVRLGFMSFFVKACCSALADFPAVNAYIEGEDIVYNHFYNIGIAVSTERGLLVPVLRDADKMSFGAIESAIRDFASRAKNKKLSVDELSGGTFTITNGGVFGSLLSTPIPNPPQTAILGMHAIQKRAVVAEDQIVIRPMMYVALTYDHRLIDGREAVSFLMKVKNQLEDPQRLLLDL
jgi:2-oxoglutarate dehydrogenase E2 component (dihydrolipoamide succinyltransferase)